MAFKLPSSMYQNPGLAGAANSLASAMFDKKDKTGLDPSQIYAHESLARQRKAAAALDEQKFGMWGDVQRAGNLSPIQIATGRQSTYKDMEGGLSEKNQRENWMAVLNNPNSSLEQQNEARYLLSGESMPGAGTAYGGYDGGTRDKRIADVMTQQTTLQTQDEAAKADIARLEQIALGQRQTGMNVAAGARNDATNVARTNERNIMEAGLDRRQVPELQNKISQILAGSVKPGDTVYMTQDQARNRGFHQGVSVLPKDSGYKWTPSGGVSRTAPGVTGKGKDKTYVYSHSDDIQLRNSVNTTLGTYYDRDTGAASEGYEGIGKIPGGVFSALGPEIKAMVQDNTQKHFGKTGNATKEIVANLMNKGVTVIRENDDAMGGDDVSLPTVYWNELEIMYDAWRTAQQEVQGLQMIASSMRSRGYSESEVKSVENWLKGIR